MPHLQFELSFAPSAEEKTHFATAVVRHFSEIMDTGTDHIGVTLRCFAPEDLTFGRAAASGGRTAFVNADIRLGRTRDQKRRLALAFIDEIARTWGVVKEAVYVIFTEHDGEHFQLSDRVLPSWSKGEDPLADKARPESMNDDIIERINTTPGWVKEMGITILTATPDEVTCEWTVEEKHHQGYGIVHGGVHCGVIETLASIGAAVVARPRGQRVVGLENSTSFIRAVRAGKLHAKATPVTRGRTTQVWEGSITDEQGQLVAQGRVRLLCIEETRTLG